MNISKLAIALATFATITLASAAYISTKEVTSAVIVDKAKHSLEWTTNGLHNISISEAFTIDKSEAAQINFLRCSFARPEFRFSWYCHQLRTDGKMTTQSYVALKADKERYFKDNVIKSVGYEAQKWILKAEQLRLGASIENSHRKIKDKLNAADVKEELGVLQNTEQGGSELMTAGKQVIFRKIVSDSPFAIDPINEINKVSISEIIERFIDSDSPSKVEDFDAVLTRTIAQEQSK